MKREIQVTLNTGVHDALDGTTLHGGISVLQRLFRVYEPRCKNLCLDWDGDGLGLIGTREETDEEEQKREQRGQQEDPILAAELKLLALLKAKYEVQQP